MYPWQQNMIIIFILLNAVLALKGIYESHIRKNAFGVIHTGPLGMYVWGDAVVIGSFWAGAGLVSFIAQDWVLFWLVFSLFWVVRSFGEIVYWIIQQHTQKNKIEIKNKLLYKYFHNESVLFIYQITQQCILVASILASIYLTHLWLNSI